MREIGSEFWTRYEFANDKVPNNEIDLLSGRSALRFIIDDIKQLRNIKKALLPSYCCESMIIPFVQSGIDVSFYSVDCNSIDYPYENDADIVLLIDFFGYTCSQNVDIACYEKKAGKIIIYDATHKINGNSNVQKYADYSFCSYRKWFYCNCARVTKHTGNILIDFPLKEHKEYIELRDSAAKIKKSYMMGLTDDKTSFLNKFEQAEKKLENDYVGYAGQMVDFDINDIVLKRKNNAEYLISRLIKIPEIKLWRKNILQQDAPMFVPILVDPAIRNDLRKALINESIYCPIHWPVNSYCKIPNKIYDSEISLICDQRYNREDMTRLISVIEKYFKFKR